MSINFNHVTNDISASSGSVTINGASPGGSSTLTISNKTGAYTVVAGDLGTIINCTSGTFTVSLTAAATLGSGFNCWVWNTSNTHTDSITITPAGLEKIDNTSSIILRRGEGTQIVCDGTTWQTGDKKTMRGYAENIANNISRPSASGLNAQAFGVGASASNSYATAIGFEAGAAANFSTAIGLNSSSGGSKTVTGSGAMALGGSYASGTDSFAAAIANNTSSYGATGANSVAIGRQTKATFQYSISIGAFTNATATGAKAFGYSATAEGNYSLALSADNGNNGCFATAASSVAVGNGVLSAIIGKYAYSAGAFADVGDAQAGVFVLRRATTNATPAVLTTDNTAPGINDQIILPNNSAYAFTGIVVARQQASGGTASAAWKIEGLIRREGSAGTTVLVNSATTVLSNIPGWGLALLADTTNGGLAITVTGAASTNIRWVATIQTSEVTY